MSRAQCQRGGLDDAEMVGRRGVASGPATVTHAERERNGKGGTPGPPVSLASAAPCHRGARSGLLPRKLRLQKANIFQVLFQNNQNIP